MCGLHSPTPSTQLLQDFLSAGTTPFSLPSLLSLLSFLHLFQNGESFNAGRSPAYTSLRQLRGQAVSMAAGLSLESPVSSRKEKEGAQTLGIALPCWDSYDATLGSGDMKSCLLLLRMLPDRIGHGEDGGDGRSAWHCLLGSPWVPQLPRRVLTVTSYRGRGFCMKCDMFTWAISTPPHAAFCRSP